MPKTPKPKRSVPSPADRPRDAQAQQAARPAFERWLNMPAALEMTVPEKRTFWKGVVVPPELNHVDMDDRGERSGPMTEYGPYFREHGTRVVQNILKAWGVENSWMINRRPDGDMPHITSEGGPEFMLLFKDGLWRYASFRGINGPPWYRCELHGWAGGSGEEAYLQMKLSYKFKHLAAKEEELAALKGEIAAMQARIRELIKG